MSIEELQNTAKNYQWEKVLQMVLDGANVNTVFDDGNSMVHYAATECSPSHGGIAIDMLHALGANLNATTPRGQTALYFATRYHYIPAVVCLLRHGANSNIVPCSSNETSLLDEFIIDGHDVEFRSKKIMSLLQNGPHCDVCNEALTSECFVNTTICFDHAFHVACVEPGPCACPISH